MDVKIIRATKKHAAEMGFVHSCSWQKAYANIIPNEIIAAFTPEKRAEIFSNIIESQPEEYYLFVVNDQSAGIASLSKSHEKDSPNTVGEIYSIYFHPDYWGTPATQVAFQFCIDRLKALGFSFITIWVLEDNIRARRFYEKNGFEFDGHSKEIEVGKKLREVRYSKQV